MSVRQRAVDLLYAMCDRSNAKQIVAEMLTYLETADYSIREEIVSLDHGAEILGRQRYPCLCFSSLFLLFCAKGKPINLSYINSISAVE